jgi:hypothetical protein
MKKIILLSCVLSCILSSCCNHHENGVKVLYRGDKCEIVRINDSTIVLAPGLNSKRDVEAKVVFLNREKP